MSDLQRQLETYIRDNRPRYEDMLGQAVETMQKAWKVPILFMGLSLPEHGYHAPNEYFDWGQASGGMKAFVQYFSELAANP